MNLLFVFSLLTVLSVFSSAHGEEINVPGPEAIDKLAVKGFETVRGKPGTVVLHLDLSQAFRTKSPWSFVAVQGPMVSDPATGNDTDPTEPGEIELCLFRGSIPDCAGPSFVAAASSFSPMAWDKGMDDHHQVTARIVFAGDAKREPLLLISTMSLLSGDSDALISTFVIGYDRASDRFKGLFCNGTGRNNNQRTRLIETGLLAGDIVVNEPTPNAPFAYFVTVFRQTSDGAYQAILRYRSLTRYSDGNPLSVIDSEMPEILRRLRLWKPGDPLPEPVEKPIGCTSFTLRRGVEVCG